MIKITENDYIIEMSNVRGRYVKNPHSLPFSFYFSSSGGVDHEIRVKPLFNPERLIRSKTGTLKLHGDWEFIPGKDEKHIDAQEIEKMKKFFKDNIVLFAMVWDEQMQDGILEDYLIGKITFDYMLTDIDFYEEYKSEMKSIKNVKELEKFCRDNNLVNFYGN